MSSAEPAEPALANIHQAAKPESENTKRTITKASNREQNMVLSVVLPVVLLLGVFGQWQVSAFSPVAKASMNRSCIPSIPYTHRYFRMAQDEDARLDPFDGDEELKEGSTSPASSKGSPAVDAQLQEDLEDTERRIGLYAAEIELVREQLTLKGDELEEERRNFQEEKDKLMELIADLSKNLAQRYEELERRQALVAEFEEREKGLKTQISDLTKELATQKEAAQKELTAQKELAAKKEAENTPEVQPVPQPQAPGQLVRKTKLRPATTRINRRRSTRVPALRGDDFGIIFLE